MTTRLSLHNRRTDGVAGRDIALTWLFTLCVLVAGCRTVTDGMGLGTGMSAREDEKVRQMANTDDVHGPLERMLKATGWSKSDKKAQSTNPPQAMAAFEQAQELFAQKKYKDAEKAFWAVAKKYKNYPIREEAVFMTAESEYLLEHYAPAQDTYDIVIKENPSTRHLDEISRRKFEMARIWLGFPEIATPSDVKPVNFEDPGTTPPPGMNYKEPTALSYRVPVFPNFFDKKRPLFDTQGRALEALKSIWLNDPTGPLADDALMISASYHLRKGDYVEADHLYDLLRKEFPKSPHVENAFVLGAHVKLMSYQGPEYDGTELDEARQLKESTLKLFPKREDRARIEEELKKIELAKAARLWSDVKYWNKKGKPKAVAIYCKQIITKFPDTPFAERAREQLAKISPKDKQDASPERYEEAAKPGKASAGEPNAFDDPGTPLSSAPAGGSRS